MATTKATCPNGFPRAEWTCRINAVSSRISTHHRIKRSAAEARINDEVRPPDDSRRVLSSRARAHAELDRLIDDLPNTPESDHVFSVPGSGVFNFAFERCKMIRELALQAAREEKASR